MEKEADAMEVDDQEVETFSQRTRRARVIVESPYAGDIDRNVKYARACLKDSLNRGEAPIASHLLYTQVIDDDDLSERHRGIEAGIVWLSVAYLVAVYSDLGISNGMKYAIEQASTMGVRVEFRELPLWETEL